MLATKGSFSLQFVFWSWETGHLYNPGMSLFNDTACSHQQPRTWLMPVPRDLWPGHRGCWERDSNLWLLWENSILGTGKFECEEWNYSWFFVENDGDTSWILKVGKRKETFIFPILRAQELLCSIRCSELDEKNRLESFPALRCSVKEWLWQSPLSQFLPLNTFLEFLWIPHALEILETVDPTTIRSLVGMFANSRVNATAFQL